MSIFNTNLDTESHILSFLDNKEIIGSLELLNRYGYNLANSIKNKASLTITNFLRNIIAEKKTIKYIISLNRKILNSRAHESPVAIFKLSKQIIKKYILKYYRSDFKQKALTYFICNINRDNNVRVELGPDIEKMLMFTNFFMDINIRLRLQSVIDLLDTHTNHGIYYMFDYFIKYLIINSD